MKRIIILSVIMTTFVTLLHAQSLSFLKEETQVQLELDFSEAAINGYTEANIVEYEEDWVKDQPVLYSKLSESLNMSQSDRQFGKFSQARYTLIFRPLLINKRGDLKGYFVVIDNNSKEVLATVRGITAKGGKFGTFLNLVGDGMKHSGKEITKKIRKLANK